MKMSRTTKCDLCKKCEPEVYIEHRREVNWWKLNFYPDGETKEKFDLCDQCWKSWEAFVANRITYK